MKSMWKLVEAFLLVPTNQNVKIMEIINSNNAMDQQVFVGVQRPRLVRKYQELKREEVLTARNMKVRFLRWLNWLNISFFLFLFPNFSTMRIWEFYFLRYFTVEAVYGKDLYVSNSSFAQRILAYYHEQLTLRTIILYLWVTCVSSDQQTCFTLSKI